MTWERSIVIILSTCVSRSSVAHTRQSFRKSSFVSQDARGDSARLRRCCHVNGSKHGSNCQGLESPAVTGSRPPFAVFTTCITWVVTQLPRSWPVGGVASLLLAMLDASTRAKQCCCAVQFLLAVQLGAGDLPAALVGQTVRNCIMVMCLARSGS